MAASSEPQVYLASEDNSIEPKVLESDSDSGQGSCRMGSPGDQQESVDLLENEDSDDEILVHKKSKNKKVLEESDSEPECATNIIITNSELSLENDEENKSTDRVKPRRIRAALLDSDDSDGDLVANDEVMDFGATSDKGSPQKDTSVKKKNKSLDKQPGLEMKEKSKSKRRSEKEREKMAAIENINNYKKQNTYPQREENRPPLNDSGCLLANGDLFDKDEESDNPEEESLDAIRASVKGRLNSLSSHLSDRAEEECVFEENVAEPAKRKERKAARVSKEAIKQLHSETQRILRESAVSLPYHLPQPKSIHDFFKRRSRPVCQGNAMQLIKSSTYHLLTAEDKMETDAKPAEHGSCDPASAPERVVNSELPLQNSQAAVLEEAVTDTAADDGQSVGNLEDKAIDVDNSEKSTLISATLDAFNNQESKCYNEEKTTEVLQEVSEPELKSTTHDHGDGTENSCSNVSVAQEKPKFSKLEKLRALGIDLSIKPRLCPDDGSFVNLDEPKPNKDLEALKERFLKHNLYKVKAMPEKKVILNIVRKETTADGKEELKADVVPVSIEGEKPEDKVHGKPGEKLQTLKAKLQVAMKQRRFEERQKRIALYNLDNENGYEDDEEEEEMTDESDEEEEQVYEEEGNAETLEYLLGEDGTEEESKDECLEESGISKVTISVPRPVRTESTLMLFKDSSTKLGDSIPDKMEHDECKGNDDKLEDDDFPLPTTKDSSHNSSFELIGSMIPSYQPVNKNGRSSFLAGIGGFRSPSPVTFKANFLSSASKSSGKMSEPSLPVEDSQDLYNASPEPKESFACAGVDSQFQFSLDDTQSQLLDADGFLNVGHNRTKYSSAKQRLVLDTMDENAMDANMGELLDLCSGNFRGSLSDSSQRDDEVSKKDGMEELLGLCSGKFVSQAASLTQKSSGLVKVESQTQKEDQLSEADMASFTVERENNDQEEEEFGDFQLLPCGESSSEKDGEEDEESAEEDDDEKENEDLFDDEEEIFRKQGKKRKLKLQDFMEDEAELSGSDVWSGDEDEGDENDDYEDDAIDEELPSDEELQDQVNKIHMKVTMDEDKRRLRLYQERYLADGDLHSDGPGRMRKFRWRNIDDASQMDMFHRYSELEDQEAENEDMDEAEAKRRKERFEREQWLREQSENGKKEEEEEIGESSQFMKLAKKVTEKVFQRRATIETTEPKKQVIKNPFEMHLPFSLPKMKTGSLLNKPKEVLQKLAAMPNLNPNAPRNTRKFVFHTLSPQKKEESADKSKLKVRRSISVATPSPKRFKTDCFNITTCKNRSIFPFLEN
ncbi:claspin isoform X2 [Dendrobates tinctorius]|uniref:claspin isoform X2 n=1 Tax=Dendrobates tinctorius TaxID=92724 RepID=UPI003CC96F5A